MRDFFILQQTKRKLDDVSKRLECLYDLLREYRVRLSFKIMNFWLRNEVFQLSVFTLFQSVNAKHFGFIKSIGSVGTNWRLCKWTWSSHANGIWTRFLSNR